MERQVRLAAGSRVLGLAAGIRWRPARRLSAAIGTGLVLSAAANTCGTAAALATVRSASELFDRAADLMAESATLVHRNARRRRTSRTRVGALRSEWAGDHGSVPTTRDDLQGIRRHARSVPHTSGRLSRC